MLDTEVYAKTDAGRDEIRSRTRGLSMAARAILLMVDGRRTVGAMRALIAGTKAPPDILDTLADQALIELCAGPATAAPTAPPLPAAAAAPAAGLQGGMHLPRAKPLSRAIEGEHDAPVGQPLPAHVAAPAAGTPSTGTRPPVDAAKSATDRYERLYALMNEIVRDFLAPHRRYFFQLKIERCTTADDLFELLHALQTALAKARGEAFASDVIARIRSAAS